MIIESKTGQRFVGFFKGKVLAHLKNGKCKIFIPGVYAEEWCGYSQDQKDVYGNPLRGAKLPTASPTFPPFGGKGKSGMFAMPDLESLVWCFFENDDPNFPVYFASIMSDKDLETLNDLSKNTAENAPQFPIVKAGKAKIERDVLLQFGRAYILFSPNDRIEIGFKASEKKPGEISDGDIAREDPKIILDKTGKITIQTHSEIDINSNLNAGVKISSNENSVRVNQAGIQLTSHGEQGAMVLESKRSLSLFSDIMVSIQPGQESEADYAGPQDRLEDGGGGEL